MSRTGRFLLGVFIALGATARGEAPTSMAELSPVERQQSDFYGAISGTGPGVSVTWTLGSPTVALGEEIAMTLEVRSAVNPSELLRPDLASRPDWKELFATVENGDGIPPGVFVYRLKPRNAGAWELPIPKYRYCNPRAPEGRRFPVAFAEPPKLIVRAAPSVPKPSVRIPLDAPPEFFEELPASEASSPAPGYWWALLAVGAFAPPVWIALWRWRNPDGARLARLRRDKSVRAALDALRKADRAPEPAAPVSAALLRYFRERWRLPASAQTPGEVEAGLESLGFAPARLREAGALLAACDEARFAGTGDNAVSLPDLARGLIARWEGAEA